MKLSVNTKFIKLLIVCLVFVVIPSHAAIDNAGVLDNVLARYSAAAYSWAGVFTNAASWLFWTLAVISMAWTFGMLVLRKADIGEFFAELVRFMIFTGLFWWLLINGPNIAISIYNSLRQLAGNATGLGPNLTPSSIIDIGFEIYFRVLDQSSVWSPVDSFLGLLMSLIILFFLALISINMLLLLIDGWVLAYGGIFFLGFGGSRWTSDIAINYAKTVLNLAAQLMTMVLLVGIGKTFLDDYYSRMSSGISLKELGVMFVVSLLLLFLVNKVPQRIAGITNGASGSGPGLGNFGAGAAFGAASMTAATIATGGAAMAAGASNIAGGMQAVMTAFNKANENVANGKDFISSFNESSEGENNDRGESIGNTPFAQAAGFNGNKGTTSFMSGAAKVGRIVADTGANLAKGTGDIAKAKAGQMKTRVIQRIGETVGGQIATAIKDQKVTNNSVTNNSVSFDGDSLSNGNNIDQTEADEEIANFVNKGAI